MMKHITMKRMYTIVMPTSEDKSGVIALRTIPVYLKNGGRKIKVNALLDDVSTKSYINSDIATELALQGQLRMVKVSVFIGKLKHLKLRQLCVTLRV